MTECTITSIYRKTLFSQGRIHINHGLNQRFLLSCNQFVMVTSNGRVRRVGHEQLIIGDSIEIAGTGKEPVTIQGISFITQNENKELYIVNKLDIPSLDVLTNLESDTIQLDIPKAQQQLELLWHRLVRIETDANRDEVPHSILKGKIDKRLIIIHRYIRQHYGEPLTLQLLADLINCNPVYLSNSYTKMFKITPMKYLQITRMKKAVELLKETNMSIKDITISLGYLSNSQFSSIFKRYFSCTPVEFRRNELLLRRRVGLEYGNENKYN